MDLPIVGCWMQKCRKGLYSFCPKAAEVLAWQEMPLSSQQEKKITRPVGAAAGLAYNQIVGAESAVDINLAKQLNVLLTQLGVDATRTLP